MTEPAWTTAQQDAIHISDRSVLVSAGAGSGKTAVLAQRCAALVFDAPAPCDIDQLLVVTFTEAAAAEMRERIGCALRNKLEQTPGNARARRQLIRLESARISTIHSFCRDILNRHFALADLDPQAPILDPLEADILRRESVRREIAARAAEPEEAADAFLDFLAAYGENEQRLEDTLLDINNFLTSLPDPDAWLNQSIDRTLSPDDAGLPPFWLDQLCDALSAECTAQWEAVEQERQTLEAFFAGQIEVVDVLAPFLDCLNQYATALMTWRTRIEQDRSPNGIDRVCIEDLARFEFPDIPRRNKKMIESLPSQGAVAFDQGAAAARRVRDKLLRPLQKQWGLFRVDEWADGIRRISEPLRKWVDLARASRHSYQAEKRSLGVVDFADLERMTLDLLRDESNGVARRLRREIQHVLVDEFQDVNPIQAEIIRRVSREGEPDAVGNLFTVGDVKQSIYRFRLAEPRLFLDRRREFLDPSSAGRTIDLLHNFRSTPRLLEAVNALFEKLMASDLGGLDYDDHARLVPPPDEAQSDSRLDTRKILPVDAPPIELHVLEDTGRAGSPNVASKTAENPVAASEVDFSGDRFADRPDESDAADWERIQREAYIIAERIRKLTASGRKYGDIVILLRSLKARIHLFVRTLTQLGIPVFADSAGGLFDTTEIRDMLSLLAVLDNGQQDNPLAAVLRSPLLGDPLSDTDLAMIRTDAGPENRRTPFHAAVRRYSNEGGDADLRARLNDRLARLRNWRYRFRRSPVADVLWEIYDQSGYLAYVNGLHDGRQRCANLVQLHEHARKFGEFQRQGLQRFLQYLDALREADLDLDAGALAAPNGDAVRIMTIHRSKGLEFPVVIVAELGKRFNLADSMGAVLYDRRLGLAMEAVDLERRVTFPTLPHRLVQDANRLELLAEELRVLYVALTRAKQRVILVGTGDAPGFPGVNLPRKGPLNLLTRRGAMSALQWIVAAVDAQERNTISQHWTPASVPSQPAARFDYRRYAMDDMKPWKLDPTPRKGQNARLRAVAALQPLDGFTLPDAAASATLVDALETHLSATYRFAALTTVPGVVAASIMKRRWNTLSDQAEPIGQITAAAGSAAEHRATSGFPPPKFALAKASPTHRGTWTHEFLQHLDLTGSCDRDDLMTQLAAKTAEGRFDDHQAGEINIDSIEWFLASDLGRRLRDSKTRIHREWPFVLGVEPARYDPAAVNAEADDVMLVRGIMDCVFDAGDGWEILDYKTDRVSGAALAERAAMYRGQMDIYTAAVEALWRTRPTRRWLIFLHAREVIEM